MSENQPTPPRIARPRLQPGQPGDPQLTPAAPANAPSPLGQARPATGGAMPGGVARPAVQMRGTQIPAAQPPAAQAQAAQPRVAQLAGAQMPASQMPSAQMPAMQIPASQLPSAQPAQPAMPQVNAQPGTLPPAQPTTQMPTAQMPAAQMPATQPNVSLPPNTPASTPAPQSAPAPMTSAQLPPMPTPTSGPAGGAQMPAAAPAAHPQAPLNVPAAPTGGPAGGSPAGGGPAGGAPLPPPRPIPRSSRRAQRRPVTPAAHETGVLPKITDDLLAATPPAVPSATPPAMPGSAAFPPAYHTQTAQATTPGLPQTLATSADAAVAGAENDLPPTAPRRAPLEPPGTLKAHLIGVASGLLLTPIAMILFALGTTTIMEGPDSASPFFALFLGLFELLAGTALIAVNAAITGYFSSLSLAVGALWPLALTIGAGSLRALVLAHESNAATAANPGFFWTLMHDMSTLAASGIFPTAAIIMMSASLAAQHAFELGQRRAVKDNELSNTHDTVRAAPIEPRPTRRTQIIAALVAIVATFAGLLCLIPLHDRLAVVIGLSGTISHLNPILSFGLPLLGIVLLFVAMATGSHSDLAPMAAAVVVCLIPGLCLSITSATSSATARSFLAWISDSITASMLVSGGPLLAMGLIMVACALTARWCRQAGHREKLADFRATAA